MDEAHDRFMAETHAYCDARQMQEQIPPNAPLVGGSFGKWFDKIEHNKDVQRAETGIGIGLLGIATGGIGDLAEAAGLIGDAAATGATDAAAGAAEKTAGDVAETAADKAAQSTKSRVAGALKRVAKTRTFKYGSSAAAFGGYTAYQDEVAGAKADQAAIDQAKQQKQQLLQDENQAGIAASRQLEQGDVLQAQSASRGPVASYLQ